MKPIIQLAAVVLSGCFVFLSFPTFDLFPLTWIALIPLFWVIEQNTPKRAFWYGWLAGAVTNTGGFHWITGLLQEFAHMSLPVAIPICLLLTTYQGLQYALWAYLSRKIVDKTSLPKALIYPITFTVIEFLLPMIFPWYLANSQYKFYAVIQICELTGVLGLTFLIVFFNYGLYAALNAALKKENIPWILLSIALGAFLANVVFGLVRIGAIDQKVAEAKKWKIGLVEANIGIWEKEAKHYPPEHRDKLLHHNLLLHHSLSKEITQKYADLDLLVWPESSYQGLTTGIYLKKTPPEPKDFIEKVWIPRETTWFYQSHVPLPETIKFPDDVLIDMKNANLTQMDKWAVQRDFKVPLLFGAITYRLVPEKEKKVEFYNTSFLIDENGKVLGAYDKTYLLMFGEYLPLVHYWPKLEERIREILPEAGDFIAGKSVEVIPFKGAKIGIMICYEDIIPRFTRKLAGKDPNIIINVTNDAWFGKTSEPYLHLALSIFRAIENRVVLIRSTNTGVSAFIDPVGRIIAETDLDSAEILVKEVPLMDLKTVYRYFGDYFGYINIAAFLFFIGYGAVINRGSGGRKDKSSGKPKKPREKSSGKAKKSRNKTADKLKDKKDNPSEKAKKPIKRKPSAQKKSNEQKS